VAHLWERIFCISLSYLLALYWLSIIRKFCWVFFPSRVSQDKCCVSCDCVFLSDLVLCYCYLLNAKNYNNGLNINMVSEPRKHLSQE
jgi:hypothetical protein